MTRPQYSFRCIINVISLLSLVLAVMPAGAATITEVLSDRTDVEITHYPAQGDYLVLWIAPDYGFRKGQHQLATDLAAKGLEIWMADLTETLFLSRGSRSMRQLDGRYVAELITRAHERTRKKITLVSSFYGAIPSLRGARQWQLTADDKQYLTGALLFSPALYSGVPALGKDPDYLPISEATNIPVVVFQGETNGMRWQINTLLEKLHNAGSPAYATIMPKITSLFYPEEHNQAMRTYFNLLPDLVVKSIRLLDKTPHSDRAVPSQENTQVATTGPDIELRPYSGDVIASPIRLVDIGNELFDLNDFKGKVTVVNFWATWCPPCVEEIPSLNRMLEKIDHPDFRMVSVNFAEAPKTIQDFLDEFEVKFPVLLDQDGKVSRNWKVIVFPSTYVIDTTGKIRYGVNAAIEWDSQQTINTIKSLLPKRTQSHTDTLSQAFP